MGPDVLGTLRDALARQVKKVVDVELDPKSEPRRNPYGANWIRQRDLGKTAIPVWGRVVDALAYAHLYKVQLENGFTLWCTMGGHTGFGHTGARQLNTLTPGTGVYCLIHPLAYHGTIIATDPDYITHPDKHRSDFITQTSRCGPSVDAVHNHAYQMRLKGQTGLYPGGRPVDGLMVGEWGAITETGLMVFLDPFMAQVRVDEETGLFMWYRDQLLRLGAHNLQIRSALRELEDWDDQGELASVHGVSVYAREALGAYSLRTLGSASENPTLHRVFGLDETHATKPEYANLEPKHDDQQPFRRLLRFEGYLGQGFHEVLCVPPRDAAATEVNRFSVNAEFPGVYAQSASLAGGWSVRSAKRVLIAKTFVFPIPKMNQRPENSDGDANDNYKFGGRTTTGTNGNHKIIDGPKRNPDEEDRHRQNLIAAAQVLDLGAFAFNWETTHPFFYHYRDWYLPDPDDLGPCLVVPPFCELRADQSLRPPTPRNLKVDHRYQESGGVDFYPTDSIFGMHEDGSVVLGDGYGSEIKMAGGNVHISAPGDVWLQSGKNVNVWAGWDFAARAYNSFDISATRRDGRIKAEHNLMFLAGNGECGGGILLESRSRCPLYEFERDGHKRYGEDVHLSGVTIKALDSNVVVLGQRAHVRTRQGSGPNAGEVGSGGIVLDANGQKVQVYCNYLERFLGQAAFDFFGSASEPVRGNEWWAHSSLIGSALHVDGPVSVDGVLTVNDWVRVLRGHFASVESGTYGMQVPVLSGTARTTAQHNLALGQGRADQLASVGATEYFRAGIDQAAWLANNASFGYRTKRQYRVYDDKWCLFESRWQQLARINGDPYRTWSESAVHDRDRDTYPYPGTEMLTGENPGGETQSTWKQVDPTLYDVSGGNPYEAGGVYEDAKYNLVSEHVLDGNYPIIMDE